MLLSRNSYFLFIISFVLIFYSCNEQDKIEIEKSASAFDIKQGEASVLQSNQRFMNAFSAGDSVEVSNCYTTNAKAMPAGQPAIKGRENIMYFFADKMESGIAAFNLTTTKIWGDSSILAEEGTYEIEDKSKKQVDKGKYIVLWKREAGNWKMYRDIWTSDLPVSAIQPKKVELPEK